MQIFISWSKDKSKELALAIKDFLEGLFHNSIKIWMSDQSIDYGAMFTVKINDALKASHKCIAILTNDNYHSPWIMYEIGAVAGRNYSECEDKTNNAIIPIVFERINSSEIDRSPIGQFQRLSFQKETIKSLVEQINSEVAAFGSQRTLDNQFDLNWKELSDNVKKTLYKHSVSSSIPVTCKFMVNELSKAHFPIPTGGNVIKYENGFETQKLYDILLNNADKRLWVWGRKNRKLFSPENRDFFADLKRRLQNGFDFRCLFLNPIASDLTENAQQCDNFIDKLMLCIDDAKTVLTNNFVDFNLTCKFYSCTRLEHIIIIDNTVLFSPIIYNSENFPFPLTKAPFYIVDLESEIGRAYCEKFEKVWYDSSYTDNSSLAV